MPRSTDILSRVYRNLRKYGINTNDLQDQDIYDELVLTQDNIISEAFPDRIVTVTLEEGKDTYPLSTDDGVVASVTSTSIFVTNDLTGTKDGANTVFTFPDVPITGTEIIFLNGVKLKRDTDYTISGSTVTIITTIPISGDHLEASYFKVV